MNKAWEGLPGGYSTLRERPRTEHQEKKGDEEEISVMCHLAAGIHSKKCAFGQFIIVQTL
jgi:hypothetical protein